MLLVIQSNKNRPDQLSWADGKLIRQRKGFIQLPAVTDSSKQPESCWPRSVYIIQFYTKHHIITNISTSPPLHTISPLKMLWSFVIVCNIVVFNTPLLYVSRTPSSSGTVQQSCCHFSVNFVWISFLSFVCRLTVSLDFIGVLEKN